MGVPGSLEPQGRLKIATGQLYHDMGVSGPLEPPQGTLEEGTAQMYHGMGISGSLEPQGRLEGGTGQLYHGVGVSGTLEKRVLPRAAVQSLERVQGYRPCRLSSKHSQDS